MDKKEFKYVDVALGGVEYRNHVLPFDEICLPENPVDCYATYFRFQKDFCDYVNTHKTVSGYPGARYSPVLPVDIDNEADLNEALQCTRNFVRNLQDRYDLVNADIAVFFTGFKGFNIELPEELFGGFEPSENLHQQFKRIMTSIADGLLYDTSIYDPSRLYRLPNSVNSKANRYKIYLTCQELFSLDIDQIQELAKSPREITPLDPTPRHKLIELYQVAKHQALSEARIKVRVNSDRGLPCYKRIQEEGVSEGQRDNIAFRLAIYFKNQGLTAETALVALRECNRKNKPPLEDRVIIEKVQSSFEHDYSGYGCEQDYMREFCRPECPVKKIKPADNQQTTDLPEALSEFLKRNIPPLEYYVTDLLPKKGKGMISAQANIGKSLLSQNLALALTSGKDSFLNKFSISPAKVLYLDLEMGESALKERFQKMCKKDAPNCENLFVKYLPSIDLLVEANKQLLEGWLAELKVDGLIIDPLGNAWIGNENEQEQVSRLTAYLNNLIDKFGVSLLVVHHWRKNTKEFKSGGQMAAGSYKWEAWLDCHITLEGAPQSITISCQKNRNRPRFSPFLAKINEETLWFEFLADYERKFDESTLIKLFDGFGLDKVAIPELIRVAKEQKICSEATVRKLLKETTLFETDKTGKTHYLIKKGDKRIY